MHICDCTCIEMLLCEKLFCIKPADDKSSSIQSSVLPPIHRKPIQMDQMPFMTLYLSQVMLIVGILCHTIIGLWHYAHHKYNTQLCTMSMYVTMRTRKQTFLDRHTMAAKIL